MSFSSENYKKVRAEFDAKRAAAEQKSDMRRELLHKKIDGLAEIDARLASTGFRIIESALEDGNLDKFEEIRNENIALQEVRRNMLVENGFDPDYDEPHYECEKCGDTGYVEGVMCSCLRRALTEETFKSSGIGELIKTQSFETFSTDYYKDDKDALESIEIILMLCRDYAENFVAGQAKNLLFYGDTGLGKTHISTSIAKVVIERGYDVVYDTAQNIFADFETEQFGKRRDPNENLTARYFDCDLLIIDDLGTEMTNSFTVSCLYNIINTRLNHRAAMIINTNLPQNELRSRYADRITSRMFGEFAPLRFLGRDVRLKKLIQE